MSKARRALDPMKDRGPADSSGTPGGRAASALRTAPSRSVSPGGTRASGRRGFHARCLGQRRLLRPGKGEGFRLAFALDVDYHDLPSAKLAEENLLGQDVLDLPADRPAQRPGPEDRVEAVASEQH